MNNYREQKACLNCLHSRVAASVPLYCGINNDYPKPKDRYTLEYYELARQHEQENKVNYNGICDNYEQQK